MKYFLLALSATIVLYACSPAPTPGANKENILRQGHWKLASGTITFKLPNGNDTTVNYLSYIPDCYKDDYLVFDSLNYGKRYINGTSCSAADPEYSLFVWRFTNNNSKIDLYDGFNTIFGIYDTIQPYHIDTLQSQPYIVLDTILGVLDTTDPPKILLVLDTIRDLRFGGIPLGNANSGIASGAYDIFNADVVTLTSSTFTIKFSMRGMYSDSVGIPASPILAAYPMKEDTMHYTFTYTH